MASERLEQSVDLSQAEDLLVFPPLSPYLSRMQNCSPAVKPVHVEHIIESPGTSTNRQKLVIPSRTWIYVIGRLLFTVFAIFAALAINVLVLWLWFA